MSAWFTESETHDLLAQLGTDAPVNFEPADDAPQGQLDRLAHDVTCPQCGHRFSREGA